MYDSKSTGSNTAQAQKLSAKIQNTWSKLTQEEVAMYAANKDKFFAAVSTKYSISKDEAEKTIKRLDAECASSSSTTMAGKDMSSKDVSNQPAQAMQKPAAKAS